ncbi:pyruvate, phosphate dikinase [Stomatohabitans albus]|uniref:pyruvate, phosphate dikinase n=1 Tax=Stomatohabitans albus TaxID=3110766 RepID=UPI00300C58A4
MTNQYVYAFSEGSAEMRSTLGGKGANLAEMTAIGLRVPPGFTISTQSCIRYQQERALWPELLEDVQHAIGEVERELNKGFGNKQSPLLVSVRSGAVISMPGMMDTILNLGLTDETVIGLRETTQDARFAYDSYRRFIQMFADVALGVPRVRFELELERLKEREGVEADTEISAEGLRGLIDTYKTIVEEEYGSPFPQDPTTQLHQAIEAVFRSWDNPRARVYRDLNGIDHNLGTAVTVQSMVFGNKGPTSGTGVAFTRDPSTGKPALFGEFLLNAQGEDVVAGIRTPKPIAELANSMPEVHREFVETAALLEQHYRDMQDIEFTIEDGTLYFLQTRSGKRTAMAAVRVAVDLVNEGMITRNEALKRVEPAHIDQLLHPTFNPDALAKATVLASGLPASPGAATGGAFFSAAAVLEANERGEKAILVRAETSPEDIEGMVAAQGVLTARGGMTSHAAVVARGMGTCCVAGCADIHVDEVAKTFTINGKTFGEGTKISLDGSTGKVYAGLVETKLPELGDSFDILMGWADEARRLGVRANADNPVDAERAVAFGAEGIGLCRTEHMFFEENRIAAVRRMILAGSAEERTAALAELLPHQRSDFVGIFEAMGGRPVTIRLLDPPLHEFLPHGESEIADLASSMGIDVSVLETRIRQLEEFNPMLGHRGCRLAVTHPAIYRMQVRAILEAAVQVVASGHAVDPEIMIPLVTSETELAWVKEEIADEIALVFAELETTIPVKIGTMIETPRAAITAKAIAHEAEFFSFGTNDLTQMTFGFSRDDSGPFISAYLDEGILDISPFESIDQTGVGELVRTAVADGRETNPDIKLGICGEHGGDPASITFFNTIGLDYVSCSPWRVCVARLAAAQATLN